MCRHLGYLGPPVPVGDILTRGTHSLRAQSWAPREMRGGGTINADGFGVAWWVPAGAAGAPGPGGRGVHGSDLAEGGPHSNGVHGAASAEVPAGERLGGVAPVALVASRYRNPAPIWTDPAVEEVLPQLRSTAVLGAVRSATVGMPVERTACAPFTHGRWAFSHNGVVPDWRRVLTSVAAEFDSPPPVEAESLTDSAALWVILRGLLEPASPDDPRPGHAGVAGQAVLTEAASAAPAVSSTPEAHVRQADPALTLRRLAGVVLARSPQSRLNFLLGDGETLWATTAYHSLSVLVTDEAAVVASEPYDDDPRWQAVADRQLVTVRPGHLGVESLQSDESERARS
ncbi:class II glutamine amidotransferase domain-containing protein [Nocardia thraciensis]